MLTKWTPGSRPAENETQARNPTLWRGLALAVYPTLTGGGGSTLKTFGKKAFRPSLLNGTFSWTHTAGGRSFHPDGTDGYLNTQESSFVNDMDKDFTAVMHFDMMGINMLDADRWFGAGESGTQPGIFCRVNSPSGTTSIVRLQVEDDAAAQERANTSGVMEMGDGPHSWMTRFNWGAEANEVYWDSVLENSDSSGSMVGTLGTVANNAEPMYIGGHNNNGSLLQPISAGFIMWAWYTRQLSRREISILGRDPFAIVRRRSG